MKAGVNALERTYVDQGGREWTEADAGQPQILPRRTLADSGRFNFLKDKGSFHLKEGFGLMLQIPQKRTELDVGRKRTKSVP